MDARAPRTKNWPTRNLKPARALDDVELVKFHSSDTFKSARGEWMRDLSRMGDPAFTNMIAICFVASGYMGFAKGAVCVADQNRLAADLGWGLSTARRALELAEAWGWLTKVRRPPSTNIYRMSFSPLVIKKIELEHENRIKDFEVESAKRRVSRDALRSAKSERKETSDLNEPFGQNWTNHSVRSERQSSDISSTIDQQQTSTERLGEAAPDIEGDEAEQKKEARDHVLEALGDTVAVVPEATIKRLIDRAARYGMLAIAAEIRHAAVAANSARPNR